MLGDAVEEGGVEGAMEDWKLLWRHSAAMEVWRVTNRHGAAMKL